MPIEIREITNSAKLHPGGKKPRRSQVRSRRDEVEEEKIQEIVDRVLEVIERKAGR